MCHLVAESLPLVGPDVQVEKARVVGKAAFQVVAFGVHADGVGGGESAA